MVQKTTRLHNARNPEEETNQHGKEDHRRNNKNTPHQPIAMMATTEEEEANDPIGPLDGSDQDINSDEDGENMADNPSWLGSLLRALTCVEEELENNKQQESATNAHVAAHQCDLPSHLLELGHLPRGVVLLWAF